MFKTVLLIFLIITLNEFVGVQAEPSPNFISMLGDSFASSARLLTHTVGNILNIQNPVTPALCGLRTVRTYVKIKFIV